MFNNQYFSAQYFPPQYHTLLGGTQIQEGRSGYYRLFFHQLQEKALESNKSKTTKLEEFKEPYKLQPQSDGSVKVEYGQPSKVKVEDTPSTEPKLPTFRAKVLEPQPEPISLALVQSWQITLEVRKLVSIYEQNKVKYQYHLDVANDEADIELLLLVA